MSAEVIKNRWWKSVPRTDSESDHFETTTVVMRSLDALADQIRRAQGSVVHCQCELVKAEVRLEEAKAAFVEAVLDIDHELQALKGRT